MREMTCGIYELKCLANGKVLVGSSTSISRRHSQHLWDLRRGIHKNPHLQNAFSLYGEGSFEVVILEKCDKSELLQKEDWWIAEKKSLDRNFGFNLKPAERPTHSKETCERISQSKTGCNNPMYGKRLSEEHKDKISKALWGSKSPLFGKTPSEETRRRMSESQKGKKLSDETKRKIGLAFKGRILSPELKKKLSEIQKNGAWNRRKASEETKQKMSESQKERRRREVVLIS